MVDVVGKGKGESECESEGEGEDTITLTPALLKSKSRIQNTAQSNGYTGGKACRWNSWGYFFVRIFFKLITRSPVRIMIAISFVIDDHLPSTNPFILNPAA